MAERAANPVRSEGPRPRVGIPWRTAEEEHEGRRDRYENYIHAVREAGGEPVEVSLVLAPERLAALAETLDAVVLPGSPADVDPARYGEERHAACARPDANRERTDTALLEHAFESRKPVLAICYGAQMLNVHLGGSLVQDIPTEIKTRIRHDRHGLKREESDPRHGARFEPGSRLARLTGAAEAAINSSHHQSIRTPGNGLRVTARAPDGVIEAVEWAGAAAPDAWVVGVQWHPERMAGDALTRALFRDLVAAAREACSAASRI